MKTLGLLFFFIVLSVSLQAQTMHPLSDPDLMFGKVAQIKEIFYEEPKAGQQIDTLEKRITWYDQNGNTLDVQRFMHMNNKWAANPNVFSVRLIKFGSPPITTGKDSLDYTIKYDSLGYETERDNYLADGKLYSVKHFYYSADGNIKRSDIYRNGALFMTDEYLYAANRLVREKIIFPNGNVYYISYKYEGADPHNNWLKRIRTINAGLKNQRVDITERRVICFP